MKICSSRCVWLMFVSVSLLPVKCDVHATQTNISSLCLDGFMSVYLPKEQFTDLPLSIYVEDEDGGYFQAVAIAKQCHYFIGESGNFVVLTVASDGCLVKRQKHVSSVTVVVVAPADDDRVDVVESIRLVCEVKDANKEQFLPENRQFFCNKDGFNITISQNATVPPLNLDLVWIPSGLNLSCKPKKTSDDAVTFSFPFTDCGVQSVVSGEIISYWVDIEVKQCLGASIIRDAPFHLTVNCSFTLTQMTRLDVDVQTNTFEFPSLLKSKGSLRAEMRFAKDSSYQSFFSPRDRPTVTALGQSVYVEVFVVKHEDGDLTLLLDDCWATPTHNTRDPQRWTLLVNGCPFSGDSHRTVVVSRNEDTRPLYKRFVVKLFSFIKPSSSESEVYFHCDVQICKGPGCSRSCSGGRQLRRVRPGQMIPPGVVSAGPLLYSL